MKVLAIFFINFVYINSTLVELHQSNFDIIIEIVGNYLDKYISHKTSVLSIASSSSTIQQAYFHEDLIRKFVSSARLGNFSYDILNKVDQSRQGNDQKFNVIFVDGYSSLM